MASLQGERNLSFSTTAISEPKVSQLNSSLSVSQASLPCTKHQCTVKRKHLIQCIESTEAHVKFQSAQSTCISPVEYKPAVKPTNVPKKSLTFLPQFITIQVNNIHLPFHLIRHVVKFEGLFPHHDIKQSEIINGYMKPSPNKVGDTKSNSTACCEGLTVYLGTEKYLQKTCLDKGWILPM